MIESGTFSKAKRRTVAAVATVALGALAVAVLRNGGAAGVEPHKPPVTVEVRTARVEVRDVAERATAPGTVFPKNQATVSAKISGPIARLERLEGRTVRAGQILAVLESRNLVATEAEAAAGVAEAEASAGKLASGVQPADLARARADASTAEATLANAQRLVQRMKALAEAGAISARELDDAALALKAAENQARVAQSNLRLLESQVLVKDAAIARAQVDAARGRLAAARASRSYAEIVAPVSGVVTSQKLFQGEVAAADAPILTIMQVDEVVVRANFPERVAGTIQAGDPAEISADGAEGDVQGAVSMVIPAVDTSTRTVEVWITARNDGWRLKPGAAVQARVTTRVDRGALVVPTSAVQVDDAQSGTARVAVVEAGGEGDVAHLLDVVLGIREGESIEIASGLSEGQTVVVEGNYGLADGTRIHATDGASPAAATGT